uniref:Calcium uptake protein 1, mitochondrial n=2 Tax=Macrostomum lignano TaxID=282301 RepID=A0A1I8J1V8_9PLAT
MRSSIVSPVARASARLFVSKFSSTSDVAAAAASGAAGRGNQQQQQQEDQQHQKQQRPDEEDYDSEFNSKRNYRRMFATGAATVAAAALSALAAASWTGAFVQPRAEARMLKVTEEENPSGGGSGAEVAEAAGEGEEDEKPGKQRVGFRDRKIIAYEDRIRAYSTPDKIFRYFATLQRVEPDGSTQVLMTPADFVRSITPGVKQPEGLGLDAFQRYDPTKDELKLEVRPDSVFYTLGDKALISFSDYVFLLTVLSTAPRQFEIAFRMFDLNSDGNLDIEEFGRVQAILRDQSNVGKRHRDHSTTGNTLKAEMNTALATYFFGENGQGTLSVARMLEFQARLQRELNRIEFDRYQPDERDRISELSFARLLITYAGFSEAKKRKMLRRVREAFGKGDDEGEDDKAKASRGISFKQYVEFAQLLKCIADVDTALTFYHLAGAAIDKSTFKHVAVTVAGIQLDDHVLDVVFVLFDEDGDLHLSNKEFVSVMKHRMLRGLDRPMDTGLVRFLSALSTCAQNQVYGWFAKE